MIMMIPYLYLQPPLLLLWTLCVGVSHIPNETNHAALIAQSSPMASHSVRSAENGDAGRDEESMEEHVDSVSASVERTANMAAPG